MHTLLLVLNKTVTLSRILVNDLSECSKLKLGKIVITIPVLYELAYVLIVLTLAKIQNDLNKTKAWTVHLN